MSYIGKVEDGKVILPPEAYLTDGTEVEVRPIVTAQEAVEFTDHLLGIAQRVHDLPPDLAQCHDHYLHGLPKR